MGRVRLKELMDFHNQGKETFRVAMKAWRKEAKEFSARYEYADDDHLIARRDEIESLLDRGHTPSHADHPRSLFDIGAEQAVPRSL